ncbi:DNA adenine methylase (dam) [Enterococcus durans]|uniref:DNA adenine methylase n=1 Tax=Enterococcaceae TaxID=81852 RepID=UPI000DFF01C8|nr:DNA adenine methylase [Enterococcus durans]STQ48464.1 DNA adenine methylase (dam) [Enterococcus durans]
MQSRFIKSALNYTGGKYKILPQIIPHFPRDYERFIDLFAGGATVSVNIACLDSGKKYLINDIEDHLIKFFEYLKKVDFDTLVSQIESKISYYGLSNSKVNGYKFYNLDSYKGLGSYNKEKYKRLRDDYNISKDNILFYLLIVYGFNNQIRFNSRGEFNLPVGKRDFNKSMMDKLRDFHQCLNDHSFYLSSRDFREIEINQSDFIYADPPYRISTASYNENGGWSIQDDLDLMDFLDKADSLGAKFALSNVVFHKGQYNEELINWAKKYNLIELEFHYNNSNYQSKAKENSTQEVLITNYSYEQRGLL